MSKKPTSLDIMGYIFGIGVAAIILGSAFWIMVIGVVVFIIWMVIRAILGKDDWDE